MMTDDYVTLTIGRQKNIALIAHDNMKRELVEWVKENAEILKKHFLVGTGTTARLIAEESSLPVRAFNSGPLGGDQQIGARIVEGRVDFVIFFWDPLQAQPHDPDVKALQRVCVLYDIPFASNRATADFLLHSELMDKEYERKILNFNKTIQSRLDSFK